MEKYVFTALLGFSICVSAQETQVLRGRVVNGVTQKSIQGVTVSVLENQNFNVLTDSLGMYSLLLPYGKYSVFVQQANYKTQLRENVLVVSGKQQVQDFELTEFKKTLDTVNIQAAQLSGAVSLDPLNTQRVAAVFYDPARLVNSHAGVINTDDQANHLSVHGTSPNYIQWKIEGVEVVNPNHLENAGMINDKPALNGGGVSMLSAQLLQSSSFNFAPFDASSGNALTGIFDIRLRKGNDQKSERIIQASLLGTDICLEGPFSKKSSASYLVNYRYSTVGLLSLMGVNFGDEKISYSDLSYLISLPYKKGNLRIFGIYGNGYDYFKAKNDSLKVESQKDFQNINYNSFTAINGISIVNSVSNSAYIKNVICYSSKHIKRTSEPGPLYAPFQFNELDNYFQDKLSTVHYWSRRTGTSSRIKVGSYMNYYTNSLNSSYNAVAVENGTNTELLLQPFISYETTFQRKIDVEAGLHSFYLPAISYFSLQPRILLRYNTEYGHSLALRYGRSSQVLPPVLYFHQEESVQLKPTITDAVSAELQIKIRRAKIITQAFYQLFYNTIISPVFEFAGYNYFNEAITFPLQEGGKAKVYGADLTIQHHYRDFYMALSSSVYNSVFSVDSKTFKQGRFNTSYNIVLTAGDEFKLKNPNKLIGVNLRGMLRDGFYEQKSVAVADQFDYSRKLPQYYRIDLRVSYRKNRLNSSYIWAIDIQNLLNHHNIANHYYDRYTNKEEVRYQLGLIPVLSFKVMF